MREYEVVFVVKATLPDEEIDKMVDQLHEVVKQRGVEMLKLDKWGRRKLAYDIGKEREGYYVLFHMNAEAEAVHELERRFKMNDAIIRFLSVRIDDELRRAKRRAELRAKRKGGVAAAAPRPAPQDADEIESEADGEAEDEEEEG